MDNPYSNRRFEQRICGDADQAEFSAILRGSTVADSGIYDDRIAGALDDFEHPMDEAIGLDWHQRDLQADDAVGDILEEINRRQAILGDAYPFLVDGNGIMYMPSESGIYEFCLAASVQKDISTAPFNKIPKAFERISALIVQRFLGEPAEALHTGAPRDAPIVRFDAAMAKLHDLTGEWVWNPEDGLPTEQAMNGDEGLDFVVWKGLGDQRMGKLFITGQCACGDNWEKKLRDLDFDRLRKWFHPMTRIDPVRSMTLPIFLSEGNMDEAQRLAGLVFDRGRLTNLSKSAKADDSLGQWRQKLKEITETVIT